MNAVIHFSILNALSVAFDVYSGTPIIFINITAASVAIAHSYVWNKRWTFRARGAMRMELSKFVAVNLGGLLLDTATVFSLTTFLAPPGGVTPLVWENIAKLCGLTFVVSWNFLGFKYFVFSVAGREAADGVVTNRSESKVNSGRPPVAG